MLLSDLASVGKIYICKAFAILGCCMEYVGSWLPAFLDIILVPSVTVKQFSKIIVVKFQ